MKGYLLALCVAACPAVICAQQADPCAGLAGPALAQCRGDQQKLQQQQLQQQLAQQQQLLQQQQERQSQLAEQQRQMQQQLENMRLQNELLQKQLEHDRTASQSVQASATEKSKAPETEEARALEVKSWKADNPWYGVDYAKTALAMRYAQQLQRQRPELTGRAFLDAVSAKVNETFIADK